MEYQSRIAQWMHSPFDQQTQSQVALLAKNPKKAEDAFYKDLEFGTGGMRGIMGVGTNRINKYTLGKNTQGLSEYLKKQYPNEKIRTVIAYDCRNQSKELAKICADVFPLRPGEIVKHLDLKKPRYYVTSSYGHFGRNGDSFTWEQTDLAEKLRSAAKI